MKYESERALFFSEKQVGEVSGWGVKSHKKPLLSTQLPKQAS